MSSIITLFIQFLMGWVRDLINWLWQVINSGAASSTLTWLQQNGLKTALILLIAGSVIDLLVRFGRWGTLKVYASFFRRLRPSHDDDTAEEELDPPVQPAVLPGQAHPQPTGSLLKRAVQTVKSSLGNDDEVIRYQPAAPAFDRNDVYHPPVMPSTRPKEADEAEQPARRRRRTPHA